VALIGMLIGGTIGVYLLYAIWEFALFKRVMDDPVAGKLSAVGAAYFTAGVLGGFGMADGGPFAWNAFAIYLIPALIVGAFAHQRGSNLRVEKDGAR
jgi:hypothetical protein